MKLGKKRLDGSDDRACAFCKKRYDQVARLIAGPGVYICDQCIRLANEILEEEGIPT